jgi:hypothetical protein
LNKRYLLRYLFISIALLLNACEAAPPDSSTLSQFTSSEVNANASVESAYAKKLRDVQVSGHGVVTKLLPDDQKGARHQKFLVRINTKQTLLFAHNIDLAERLPVKVGNAVSFNGEYVYNPKGGIVHWTHLDPQGTHTPGWILLQGKKYQ